MSHPIHVEVWIASQILGKDHKTFTKKQLMKKVEELFNDTRNGVSTHISSYCVASTKANPAAYRYLTRVNRGEYRRFKLGDETHPSKENAPLHPNLDKIPEPFWSLLDIVNDNPDETEGNISTSGPELAIGDVEHLGFRKIGEFSLDNGTIEYTLIDTENDKGCYLFCYNNEIYYVGQTKNGIKTRLYQYKNPSSSQVTNKRINELLQTILGILGKVEILFLNESIINKMQVQINKLSITANIDIIETFLISGLLPKWNR